MITKTVMSRNSHSHLFLHSFRLEIVCLVLRSICPPPPPEHFWIREHPFAKYGFGDQSQNCIQASCESVGLVHNDQVSGTYQTDGHKTFGIVFVLSGRHRLTDI